jgi:hypothetical protein
MGDRATRARLSAPLGPYADGCQTVERNGVTRRVRRRAMPEVQRFKHPFDGVNVALGMADGAPHSTRCPHVPRRRALG